MAETQNIGKMAEALAKGLFARFQWRIAGSWNQNWPCVIPTHQKATHPSDVVFFYDEPYYVRRTYVHTDLKSYAKGSITKSAILASIEKLAREIECAEVSVEWQKRYTHEDFTVDIVGLLFIYNHDGEYDNDFDEILKSARYEKIRVPKGKRLFVLGPQDIRWLDNVQNEIVRLRGLQEIPISDASCRFFYPELVRRKKVQPTLSRAATLEMLMGPWITLEYSSESLDPAGYIVFYRGEGKTAQEFVYLIDWMMHFQMVRKGVLIRVRALDVNASAAAHFLRATQEYVEGYEGGEDIASLLKTIDFAQMPVLNTRFSELEIGMDND